MIIGSWYSGPARRARRSVRQLNLSRHQKVAAAGPSSLLLPGRDLCYDDAFRTSRPRLQTPTVVDDPAAGRRAHWRPHPPVRLSNTMNLVVLGAQWGDEGKGKIVDWLTPRFDIVARYQGGHNAGHTVHAGGRKFVLRLLPSGILHPATTCVIGNGVVVDPQALFGEVDQIEGLGIEVGARLAISNRAHLILPYHRELDLLSEARRGERRIGTTSRGIGPAYEDKIGRRGLRVGDLGDSSSAAALADAIKENVQARNRLIGGTPMDWQAVLAQLHAAWSRLAPWVKDVSLLLSEARAAGRPVLYEGAQGTLLDIDHGTYPYVTSSNATVGGVLTGLGVGPRAIDAVLGVSKAYTTRVGDGPMPTELEDATGEELRRRGHEFGAVTGRPRRCGWFDAVVVRYAVRVNGLDALALTKLDVLDGLPDLQLCVGYRAGGTILKEFPSDLGALTACEPVYERHPGWSAPTAGVRRFDQLPAEARAYVRRIEELVGAPVQILSTGADRDDTIVSADGRVAEGLAGSPRRAPLAG
jgi:adenylosuccinate synthase